MTRYYHHTHDHHEHSPHGAEEHTHSHHGHGHVQKAEHFEQSALERLKELYPNPETLGRLRELAAHLCAIEAVHYPKTRPCHLLLFAEEYEMAEADRRYPHAADGILHQRGIEHGEAPVCVLAKAQDVPIRLVSVGPVKAAEPSSAWFAPSLSIPQVASVMKTGSQAAADELKAGAQVLILGRVERRQTWSAYGLAAIFMQQFGEHILEKQPGMDETVYSQLVERLREALASQDKPGHTPVSLLAHLGTLPLAAMVGAMIQAGSHNRVILLDSLASTVAGILASRIDPTVRPALIAGSLEPGLAHPRLLHHMGMKPLLDMGIASEDGLGALTALSLLDSAAALFHEGKKHPS
ncbi:MAG: nicotinate-nucleotide--dimethylbenzimidazole phosphoribosyltransferase [bacterium]|jgi:nicotinate-nucleotide--dimethylbenzimidazole phosphoribosyltransferase|nr:nicotinate-nucleotide--dimethylbenzimidazole phosphoribosyltransferase [bacterium]